MTGGYYRRVVRPWLCRRVTASGDNQMPRKPKHPCNYPGCPELTTEWYCKEHKRRVSKNYEVGRETAVKRGYDTRWKAVRKLKLSRDPLCQCDVCQNAMASGQQPMIANCVHHINGNTKDNRRENLLSMHGACHNRLHIERGEKW